MTLHRRAHLEDMQLGAPPARHRSPPRHKGMWGKGVPTSSVTEHQGRWVGTIDGGKKHTGTTIARRCSVILRSKVTWHRRLGQGDHRLRRTGGCLTNRGPCRQEPRGCKTTRLTANRTQTSTHSHRHSHSHYHNHTYPHPRPQPQPQAHAHKHIHTCISTYGKSAAATQNRAKLRQDTKHASEKGRRGGVRWDGG